MLTLIFIISLCSAKDIQVKPDLGKRTNIAKEKKFKPPIFGKMKDFKSESVLLEKSTPSRSAERRNPNSQKIHTNPELEFDFLSTDKDN